MSLLTRQATAPAERPGGTSLEDPAALLTPPRGSTYEAIDTPFLAVELDAFEANVARFAEMCHRHGKAWRPHAKGHKSIEVARRLVAAGAIGATCAKLGEAEVLASGGLRDLLIANQVVGPLKLARLLKLCRVADPIVAVDDLAQAGPLADLAQAEGVAPRVVIEVNLGLDRAGVAPGDAVVALAEEIAGLGGLRFAGLLGYEGHLLTLADPVEKDRQVRAALGRLADSAAALGERGLPCPVVSAGGTGSSATALTCPGISELQSGGVIFMDAFYRQACQVAEFEFALWLWCTVTSRPAPGRAILDTGCKSQSVEIQLPCFPDQPALRVTQTSAEHCRIEWPADHSGPSVGDRLRLVPGYADLTCNLHRQLYVFRQGVLVDVWPMQAQGMFR